MRCSSAAISAASPATTPAPARIGSASRKWRRTAPRTAPPRPIWRSWTARRRHRRRPPSRRRRRRRNKPLAVADEGVGAGEVADIGLVGNDPGAGDPAMQMESGRLEVEARWRAVAEIERHLMGGARRDAADRAGPADLNRPGLGAADEPLGLGRPWRGGGD